MAPPKRKSPEKKPAGRAAAKRNGPSAAMRILRSTVAGIARYPRLVGGLATFGVVFSFVAANALWYQPRHHPAPLLVTRMFESDAKRQVRSEPDTEEVASAASDDPGVTTFRIERQDDRAAEPAPTGPIASPLVKAIQQSLASRGLYDGPVDGVTGPKTTAAILFFEETEGLEQTGEATSALLSRIKSLGTKVAVIPDERPSPDVTASTKTTTKPFVKKHDDDVADLIRAAEVQPVAATPVKTTAADKTAGDVSPETVMKIQKALSRFAYAKVKVDGVAGEATRAAIRAFEKNYNLPVTGEPSERVVKKLKSIGAI